MKLLSMTNFILHLRGMTTTELCEENPKAFKPPTWNGSTEESVKDFLAIDARLWKMAGEYAKFLKRPLKLEMFVPCDEEGNVLIKPSIYDPRSKTGNTDYECFDEAESQYQKAKEKVLFEGIDQGDAEHLCDQYQTLEEMVNYCNETLTLTSSAQNQIK